MSDESDRNSNIADLDEDVSMSTCHRRPIRTNMYKRCKIEWEIYIGACVETNEETFCCKEEVSEDYFEVQCITHESV